MNKQNYIEDLVFFQDKINVERRIKENNSFELFDFFFLILPSFVIAFLFELMMFGQFSNLFFNMCYFIFTYFILYFLITKGKKFKNIKEKDNLKKINKISKSFFKKEVSFMDWYHTNDFINSLFDKKIFVLNKNEYYSLMTKKEFKEALHIYLSDVKKHKEEKFLKKLNLIRKYESLNDEIDFYKKIKFNTYQGILKFMSIVTQIEHIFVVFLSTISTYIVTSMLFEENGLINHSQFAVFIFMVFFLMFFFNIGYIILEHVYAKRNIKNKKELKEIKLYMKDFFPDKFKEKDFECFINFYDKLLNNKTFIFANNKTYSSINKKEFINSFDSFFKEYSLSKENFEDRKEIDNLLKRKDKK